MTLPSIKLVAGTTAGWLTIAAIGLPALAQQQQQQPRPRAPSQQPAPQRAPAPQPAFELPPSGTMFVVVDPNQIMTQATAAEAIRNQFDKQRVALQGELQKQETDLKNADQELARQRAILSPEAYAQRRRDLDKRVGDANQMLQNRKRDFDRSFAEATRQIERAMLDSVAEIVQERDYKVVMNKAAVVIVQTSLDITPEVVRRLNRKLPTVTVAIPKN